ncbi:hypothetical protein ACFL3V_04855 [Nanoarchaeota archaeon]
MRPIVIFGVCHTAATANETIKELKRFPFSKDTLVFIEPKKRILEGKERYADRNIKRFFRLLLDFLFEKEAEVIPLNPTRTPSHEEQFLLRKIAKQFAEEEFMVELIASTKTERQKVVIIGDIHAARMTRLLKAKGIKVTYKSISKKTPDDILLHSWRQALLGRTKRFISLGWLNNFKKDLKQKLALPKDAKIPAIFYGDEKMYQKYLAEAYGMMQCEEKLSKDKTVECRISAIKESRDIKDKALDKIRATDNPMDHRRLEKKKVKL